ncbi:MAG: hypothetical protein ACK5MW_04225 [Enterococcus sp.]
MNNERFTSLTRLIGEFAILQNTNYFDEQKQPELLAKELEHFRNEFTAFANNQSKYNFDQALEMKNLIFKQLNLEPEAWTQLTDEERATLDDEALLMLVSLTLKTDFEPKEQANLLVSFLKQLKTLEWQRLDKQISRVELVMSGPFSEPNIGVIDFTRGIGGKDTPDEESKPVIIEKALTPETLEKMQATLTEIHPEFWAKFYDNFTQITDGTQWSAIIYYQDGSKVEYFGDNSYPATFETFQQLFTVIDGKELF